MASPEFKPCLLMAIILVAISGYSIGGYWWLLIGITLMAIDSHFVVSH